MTFATLLHAIWHRLNEFISFLQVQFIPFFLNSFPQSIHYLRLPIAVFNALFQYSPDILDGVEIWGRERPPY